MKKNRKKTGKDRLSDISLILAAMDTVYSRIRGFVRRN